MLKVRGLQLMNCHRRFCDLELELCSTICIAQAWHFKICVTLLICEALTRVFVELHLSKATRHRKPVLYFKDWLHKQD